MEQLCKDKNTLPKYMFFIELKDGTRVEWNRLTAHAAKQMYRNTSASEPHRVHRYGWEEVRP